VNSELIHHKLKHIEVFTNDYSNAWLSVICSEVFLEEVNAVNNSMTLTAGDYLRIIVFLIPKKSTKKLQTNTTLRSQLKLIEIV
jgi:hypothetical protein